MLLFLLQENNFRKKISIIERFLILFSLLLLFANRIFLWKVKYNLVFQVNTS